MSAHDLSVDFKTPAVLEVEWIDCYGTHGWQQREERIQQGHEAAICRSVGYLFREDGGFLHLTESVTAHDHVGCSTAIPLFAIVGRRVLREAE